MKKTLIVTVAFVLSAIIITSGFNNIKKDESPTNIADTEPSTQKYIISEFEGRIALYKSGEKEPLEVYPVFASSLPDSDYARIKKGICVESNDELHSLLDDYLS